MSDDNILHFQQRPKPEAPETPKPPPMLNIPLATKALAGIFLLIHVVIWGLTETMYPTAFDMAVTWGGFIPAAWSGMLTGNLPFSFATLLSVISFSFLHGGWMHLGVNILMLVALGSGLEKTLGIQKYLMIYAVTTLAAAITHYILFPMSPMPIVGASGGVSGIFGAMLYVMNVSGALSRDGARNNFWPIVIIYVGISAVVGWMGAPDGSPVAWVAHIGGFIAGIGITQILQRRSS